jgi:hypothetical protein
MTEQDWLSCGNPILMLESALAGVSERKARPVGIACCRRIWHLVTDSRFQEGLIAAEQFVDGLIRPEEYAAIAAGVRDAFFSPEYMERFAQGDFLYALSAFHHACRMVSDILLPW